MRGKTEGYGFIEFEMSNSIISTVFRPTSHSSTRKYGCGSLRPIHEANIWNLGALTRGDS